MQNLLDELKNLLQQDERLVVDGKLLKNKIIELGLQLDPSLIKMLLSHPSIKKHFFQEVESILIFDKIKFQKFVSNKAFLPDSYTSFKNKIGLTADDEFIAESKEVVLAWPYKDCVLEGGQTKEDAKRDEIFWNEILAPDEIDRLLDPKVLTNFKKYDKDGEHPVTDISFQDNLIIKGNNLLALHSLKKVYAGRIKLIYIDPPYNVEGDSFMYNDSYNHSTWLTFMKNRLEVAKILLKKDGVLFLNIGDEELHYLKVICDDIFGRDNFINTIARVSKTASNKGTYFAPSIDFLLCYARDKKFLPEFYDEVDESLYKKIETEGERKGEKYRDDVALYQSGLIGDRPNCRYYIKCPDGSEVIPPINKFWRWEPKTYEKNKHLLVFKKSNGSPLLDQNDKQAKWNIYTKSYLKDRQEDGTKPRNYLDKFINRKGADYIKKLDIDFSYSKPAELIEYLIKIVGTSKDDIILDFFAGSGTTAEATIRINSNDKGKRKFILCEQMSYINDITVKRVQKVLENESLIYCELAEANQTFIDQIQSATKTEELKTIWEAMKERAFLSYKIDPKQIDLKVTEFEGLSFEDQQKFLIEVLDKNMLYVPYSEIEDETYNISKEIKALNRKFYGL